MIQIAQFPQDEPEVFILSPGFPILTIHPERSVLVGRYPALVHGYTKLARWLALTLVVVGALGLSASASADAGRL